MAKRNSWTNNVLNVHRDKPLERVMNIFYNIQLTTRDNVRVDILMSLQIVIKCMLSMLHN
jgi:hypothetical protein